MAEIPDELLQVTIDDFFQFLQCQLCLEASTCLDEELQLQDQKAVDFWPLFRTWAQPNLGKKEKWVPFHTVLGPHEFFVVTQILHNDDLPWNAWRRFLAMFVYRAHCKGAVFREAQLPRMLQQEDFWKDPASQFADDGAMTLAMLEFRRRTRQPLQTGAFRSIPQRLCPDDDENLVRNVARRTRTLLEIAEKVWPVIQDHSLSSSEKFHLISGTIQSAQGLGETWTKMLMVTMDIAYPDLELLAESCNVGLGAFKAFQRLAPDHKNSPRRCQQSLQKITAAANLSTSDAAQGFWSMLDQVELLATRRFAGCPLILAQVSTSRGQLSASTVQVQLCEWRQFQDFLDKHRGLDTQPGQAQATKCPENCKEEAPVAESRKKRPRHQQRLGSPWGSISESEERFLSAATNLLEALKQEMVQVSLSIKHAQEDLRDCDVRRSEAEARLLTAMRATSDAELNLRKIRPNLTLCALLAEHERQISEVAEAGLAKLQAACDRLSSTQGLLHVAATSRHASAYAALPEVPASLASDLERGAEARLNHTREILESVRLRRDAHCQKVQSEILGPKEAWDAREALLQSELATARAAEADAQAEEVALEELIGGPACKMQLILRHFSPWTFRAHAREREREAQYRRVAGLLLLAAALAALKGLAFLSPPAVTDVSEPMIQIPQLLLAEIDMTKPYEPTEEPESPANSMFAITFVFVIFAFVVPILLLGMKSQNTDIAGSDVSEELGNSQFQDALSSSAPEAGTLIKKLVGEHWLEKVDDLRYVPSTRLEGWGVPLKLIDEIYDFLAENDADEGAHNVNAYVNYTLRPAVQGFTPAISFAKLRDDAEKRRHPKTWAARRLQHWFRNRQKQRARRPLVTDDQVLSWVEDGDFFKPDSGKSKELREKRAKESLKKGVARWRERKAREKAQGVRGPQTRPAPADPFLAKIAATSPNTIPAFLAQRAAANPRKCEVSELFSEFGKTLNQSDEELRPYVHRLVTINWLEEKEDLSLVEDRHWEAWAIPEKLV
ncbi:for, partial [Symbiodinium necroappetens]